MIKAFFTAILGGIVLVLFSLVLAVGVIEYVAGCGETYIDSEGTRHMNECILIRSK